MGLFKKKSNEIPDKYKEYAIAARTIADEELKDYEAIADQDRSYEEIRNERINFHISKMLELDRYTWSITIF